jgi:uncharacterized protein YjbI with pentapeptide repeats
VKARIFKDIVGAERLAANSPRRAVKRQPDEQLVLEGVDLREVSFTGIELTDVRFIECDLRGADFTFAEIQGSLFQGCAMAEIGAATGCNFSRSSITGCSLDHARLDGADLGHVVLSHCTGVEPRLDGADLYKAAILNSTLPRIRLSRARLKRADVMDSALRGADLRDCDATLVSFTRSDLRRADFEGMKMDGGHMTSCAVHGIVGMPVIEKAMRLSELDDSPEGNKSSMISEAELLRRWGAE